MSKDKEFEELYAEETLSRSPDTEHKIDKNVLEDTGIADQLATDKQIKKQRRPRNGKRK